MSGHALACLQLRKEACITVAAFARRGAGQPLGEKFVTLALANTDVRVQQGKPVSPGFLFASLLWHQVLEKWTAYKAAGEFPIPALHLAADDVLEAQTDKLALQRKIASDMRDIWAMQPRFERRVGKAPYKLLEHLRLRAGYDFLLLRCASGEIDSEIGEWWTPSWKATARARRKLMAQNQKVAAGSCSGQSVRAGAVRAAPRQGQSAPRPRQ